MIILSEGGGRPEKAFWAGKQQVLVAFHWEIKSMGQNLRIDFEVVESTFDWECR